MKHLNNLSELTSKDLLEINGGDLTEVTYNLVSGAGWLYHGVASNLSMFGDAVVYFWENGGR